MARTGLVAPWVNYYREVQELFKKDSDVHVVLKEGDQHVLSIYVEDSAKACAMMEVIPVERTYGNVTLRIEVKPANFEIDNDIKAGKTKGYTNLWMDLFKNNSAFSYVQTIDWLGITYVVFKNKVVQYYNDSLSDPNGLCSTLYQDLAKDVFKVPSDNGSVFFCTEPETIQWSEKRYIAVDQDLTNTNNDSDGWKFSYSTVTNTKYNE